MSLFLDFVLVFFVSFLCFLGGKNVATSSAAYQDNEAIVSAEVRYYANYASESHAVEYLSLDVEVPQRRETDALVLENVMRAIDHSYQVFGNAQEPDFVNDASTSAHDFTYYGEASLLTDNVSYFYTQYLPSHNQNSQILFLNGVSYQDYLFVVYTQAFGTSAPNFTFDATVSTVPVLKTQSAYALYHYLVSGADDTLTESGKSLYSVFYTAYQTMLSDAENLLIKAEPYYTQHYLVYQKALYAQSASLTWAMIASIAIAYLIIVFLPKCLFGYDRTLGRLIMGLGVITTQRKNPSVGSILLRSLFGCFGFLTVSLLLYLLPPYSGVFDTMMMPLIGNTLSLLVMLLVISCLCLANGLTVLLTKHHQSLIDLLLKQVTVDQRNQEGDDFLTPDNLA